MAKPLNKKGDCKMSDMGWSAYARMEEEMNEGACIAAAKERGYTGEQAEKCDDGNLNCKNCPWRKDK